MWNDIELLVFCEKLVAQKKYAIAEEILWEIAKRDRANCVAPALLGRIFEETKQYSQAVTLYDSSLILSEDPDIRARHNACADKKDVPGARQNHDMLMRGYNCLAELEHTSHQLHEQRHAHKITKFQLEALQAQVWPEIADDSDSWTLSAQDIDALTMGGQIPIRYRPGDGVTFTRRREFPNIYTDAQIDELLSIIAQGKPFYYNQIDLWAFEAFADFPVRGQKGAVIGSLSPWYESVCIANGAHPTTVEFRTIDFKTSRIDYLHVDDFYKVENHFDFAVSISSIEHDGLGGYNVSIMPDADLLAMRRLRQAVKPGGIVFFNVPVGKDEVSYPTHRRYGRKRFPLLIEGWEIVKSYGFDEAVHFDHDPGMHNPLFVLRNMKAR